MTAPVLELRLDQFQQSAQHVAIVFLVPGPAEVATRVAQLEKGRFLQGAALAEDGGHAGADILHPAHGDLAQPVAERPRPLPLKPRQFAAPGIS